MFQAKKEGLKKEKSGGGGGWFSGWWGGGKKEEEKKEEKTVGAYVILLTSHQFLPDGCLSMQQVGQGVTTLIFLCTVITNAGEQFEELMTVEEKAKLYEAIGYQESSADPVLPKEVSLPLGDLMLV